MGRVEHFRVHWFENSRKFILCSVHPMRGEKRRRTGNRVNNTPFGQSDRSSSYTILHQRKIERFFIFEGIFYIQEGTAFVAFAFFFQGRLWLARDDSKKGTSFTLKRQLVLRYARLHIIANAYYIAACSLYLCS